MANVSSFFRCSRGIVNASHVNTAKAQWRRLLAVLMFAAFASVAKAAETVSYLHTDGLGSIVAATDEAGSAMPLWREDYEPYGLKRNNPPNADSQRLWYTGHAHDDTLSLSYFGARWYDPEAGRFMAMDPVGWQEDNPFHSFNRFAYANNNPYKFVDPDGELPVFVIFLAKELASAAFEHYSGVSVPVSLGGIVRSAGKTVAKATVSRATKSGTETVQRAMSQAELANIRKTGVLSRTKPDGTVLDGDHFVSNAVNSSANRAKQRLALPGTPEVRVTLDVPRGVFSRPSKVQPRFNMPGGGVERTAPGNLDIPATIRRVDGL